MAKKDAVTIVGIVSTVIIADAILIIAVIVFLIWYFTPEEQPVTPAYIAPQQSGNTLSPAQQQQLNNYLAPFNPATMGDYTNGQDNSGGKVIGNPFNIFY